MTGGASDGGLRRLFRQAMPQAQWTTIETGAVAQGVPDAEFIFPFTSVTPPGQSITAVREEGGQGTQGWIEFKQTGGWAVTLRPEQIGWLSRRVRSGGRAFIAVRRRTSGGPRTPKADELWLIPLTAHTQPAWLREHGLDELADKSSKYAPNLMLYKMWSGGPGVWNWGEVARILKGETE